MLRNKINIFSEAENTAYAVAEQIVKEIRNKTKKHLFYNLAISGGSTPNLLFGMLANEFAKGIPWKSLRVFWVDERCVEPTDSDSNYGTAYELWLKHVPIPPDNIINIKGDQEPIMEALRYGDVIRNLLPEENGFPVFDLVLLGMGEDGHTASIFPNRLELLHVAEPAVTVAHPTTGQVRITLTGNVICNAEKVIFVITGHSKADVMDEILHEKGDFERYPTYYVLNSCDAVIYLDHEAAEKI